MSAGADKNGKEPTQWDVPGMIQKIEELQTALTECKEALGKFGDHLNSCDYFQKGNDSECTCGFTQAKGE